MVALSSLLFCFVCICLVLSRFCFCVSTFSVKVKGPNMLSLVLLLFETQYISVTNYGALIFCNVVNMYDGE